MRKKFIQLFLFAFLSIGCFQEATCLEVEPANKEEFAFHLHNMRIKTFNIRHQLDLEVHYETTDSSDHLDIADIKETVITFLKDYKYNRDYWEIMNKKLVHFLLGKYPLKSIEIKFNIAPSNFIPCDRSCSILWAGDSLTEKFAFEMKDNSSHLDAKWEVTYTYVKGVQNDEYLDFRHLKDALNDFFDAEVKVSLPWNEMKKLLIESLKRRFPALESIELKHVY